MPKMRDSRASQGVAESKGEEMKAETLEPLNHSPYISTVELKRLLAERERLLEALKDLLNDGTAIANPSTGEPEPYHANPQNAIDAIDFAEADESKP